MVSREKATGKVVRVDGAKRVCVCDDEAAIADLVGQLLREGGFQVQVCYAAADVLAPMRRAPST